MVSEWEQEGLGAFFFSVALAIQGVAPSNKGPREMSFKIEGEIMFLMSSPDLAQEFEWKLF